jgi:hypothetical protein
MFKTLAALLLIAAGAAFTVARPSARPLRIAVLSDDSATVVATWSASNADSVRVVWSGMVSRTLVATGSRRVDTVRVARGAADASITVTVTPVRAWRVGAVRTATVVVTARVVPPTIDSLSIDTTLTRAERDAAIYEAALADTFPVGVTRRADLLAGDAAGVIAVGDTVQLCALARNRFTGEVVVFIEFDLPQALADAVRTKCEPARAQMQSERAG